MTRPSATGSLAAGQEPGSPDADMPAAGHDGVERIASAAAAAFAEVLGLASCELEDRFFSLGGNSLSGLQVLGRLYQRFGVKVPIAELYSHSTPRAIAERLVELRARPDRWRRSLLSYAHRRAGTPLPLALSQQGFHAIEQVTRGAGFFNNVTLIRLTGDVDPRALTGAIQDVLRRQTALRVVMRDQEDGKPGQCLIDEPAVVTEVDLRGKAGSALRRLCLAEHLRGFDLRSQTPARFTVARTADDAWAVVATVHHIVFDGVSWSLLVDEFSHAYRSQVGDAEPRPALRVDYLDFAEWQRDTLTGDRLEAHLTGLLEVLHAPAPAIAPGEFDGRFASRIDDLAIPEEISVGLDKLAAECDSSLFVVLLAAVADFARRRNGQTRQFVTVQAANRNWPGSDEVIGCFANMLCVGTDIDLSSPPLESIPLVKSAMLRALRHEELPLDYALHLLSERGTDLVKAQYLPQLGFTLLPTPDARTELPGCAMAAHPVPQSSENFDPTTFPLVIEAVATETGLVGVTHRLLGMWPGESFATAERELLHALERFAASTGEPAR
jgi:acyl carrier protein